MFASGSKFTLSFIVLSTVAVLGVAGCNSSGSSDGSGSGSAGDAAPQSSDNSATGGQLSLKGSTPTALNIGTVAQNVGAGSCSGAVTVRLLNKNGSIVTAPSTTAVSLSSSISLSFYSDSNCSSQVGSINIPAGASQANFYFKGIIAASPVVTVASTGLTSATQTEVVAPGSATQVWIEATPSATSSGTVISPALDVRVEDQYGNQVTSSSAPISVALGAGSPAGTLSGTLTLNASSGKALFSDLSIATTVGGSFTLTASAAGLNPSTSGAFSVAAAPSPTPSPSPTPTSAPSLSPAALAFSTASQGVSAGSCSGVVTVQAVNGSTVTPVSASTSVALAGNGGVAFFSDAGCTSGISSVTIPAGQSQASFYFKDLVATSVAVTASSTGLTSASQSETINPGPATQVWVQATPGSTTSGTVISPAVDVRIEDQYGNPVSSSASVTIALGAGSASGTLNGTVTQNASSGRVLYSDLSISTGSGGSFTLTASSSGLKSYTTSAFTVTGSAPTALAFSSAAQSVTAGACSSVVTVQSQGSSGVMAVQSSTVVSLAGVGGVLFYSDAGCTAGITSVTIPSGQSQASFYFKDSVSGSASVTASATGLTSASQSETINVGPAAKLAIQASLSNTTSGTVITPAIDVLVEDANSNLVTSSTAPVTMALGAGSAAGTLNGTLTVNAVNGHASFSTLSITTSATGSFTLTASSTGLTSATSAAFTVSGGTPTALAFATAPQTTTAGTCVGVVTLQTNGSSGSAVPVQSATSLALAGSGGIKFYSDSGCASQITSVTVPSGSSQVSFYVKDLVATTAGVTASATGFTSATQSEVVNPGPATQVWIQATPSATTSGTIISPAVDVRIEDQYGNPVSSSASVTIALGAGSATGTLGGTLTQNASSGRVLYSDLSITTSAGGNFTLAASSAGLKTYTTAAFAVTGSGSSPVAPSGPSALAFGSTAQSVNASTCSSVVNVQTVNGTTPTAVSASTTVSLTGTNSVAFYSDAGCTTPVSSVTIASGASQASFYFKGGVSGTDTVTVAATNFTSASQSETINPAPQPTPTPTATPISTGPVVMASTEGIEKPTPERNFQLNTASTLSLSMARNESTGRVLQVSASTCQTVSVTGLPAGVTVDLFHMPFIKTVSPSFQGAVVGNHYDPLVPLYTTSNQVCSTDSWIWADITVASSVAPGSYSFNIGGLPVSLKVWNLTLPAKPTMPLYIGWGGWAAILGHQLPTSTGVDVEGPLLMSYTNMFRAHRIEGQGNYIQNPPVNADGTLNLDNWSTYQASFREDVITGALAGICIRSPAATTSTWATAAELQGWEKAYQADPTNMANAWAYLTDEPSDITGTASRAQLVRTNAPDIKTMVTHEPTSALIGLIDHFVVLFEDFKTAGHWTDYSQAPGYWNYGSCVSHGSCSNGTVGNNSGSPDLMLDQNDVHGRLYPLVAYLEGASGELYYNSMQTYGVMDPWTNQYQFGGNGDGNLVYPGITGQRGFTSQTPVASIRLKALREGMNNIEYLNFAKNAGISTNISTLVTDQMHWSHNNSDYETLKNNIGNALSP